MKSLGVKTLIGCGLLAFGLAGAASAQQYPQYNQYPQYDQRYDSQVSRMMNRVRSDIDRAEANSPFFESDHYRFTRAENELSGLQQQFASGNINMRELNDTIRTLQQVVSMNQLSDRDQNILNDDLSRLRNLRDRVESGY